ncbi:AbrB/MazE/SpoVT family DNA-binding domain-containing protein [Pararhizobium sp.]|uniref:AbrB/MazE/SpoVT family DNA-binding domain-containing protein n=1 Tax=Pararhizobium sp. TaxID=1977563 RepID=UPI003D116C3E
MKVKVRKLGNAEGVVIPKKILARRGLKADNKIAFSVTDDRLNFHPAGTDIEDQMEVACQGMDKYKVALSKLAAS